MPAPVDTDGSRRERLVGARVTIGGRRVGACRAASDDTVNDGVMPAAFLGHGSPMNALEHNRYTEAWRAFGAGLPGPGPSWSSPPTGTSTPRPSPP